MVRARSTNGRSSSWWNQCWKLVVLQAQRQALHQAKPMEDLAAMPRMWKRLKTFIRSCWQSWMMPVLKYQHIWGSRTKTRTRAIYVMTSSISRLSISEGVMNVNFNGRKTTLKMSISMVKTVMVKNISRWNTTSKKSPYTKAWNKK